VTRFIAWVDQLVGRYSCYSENVRIKNDDSREARQVDVMNCRQFFSYHKMYVAYLQVCNEYEIGYNIHSLDIRQKSLASVLLSS
jgi:hypothetical protein